MKLESALPAAIREHVGSVMDHLTVSAGQLSRHEGLDGMFDDLAGAIVARNICRLVYVSFHDRKQVALTVLPLRLAFMSRAWYLLGHSKEHGRVRTFKLGRIHTLTVLDEKFDRPTDVDLGEYFGDAWCMIPEGRVHDVHLHFDAKVAGNVAEVQWHHSQHVDWNDDGSIEFRVRVDGLGEITWWVLGYGDQVEVVAPPELRGRVAQTAAAMLARHGGEG
jgi:proteasome accessory factor B